MSLLLASQSWVPDQLGAGFTQLNLPLGQDSFGNTYATLVRYNPDEDPGATLPDRVVPDNLRPGGGDFAGTLHILPAAASPQQIAQISGLPGYPEGQLMRPELDPTDPRTTAAQSQTADAEDSGTAGGVFSSDRSWRRRERPAPTDFDTIRDCLRQEPGDYTYAAAPQWGAPPAKPSFVVLYLHGWNDYFHQMHLARTIAHLGGAFYAIDLRRFGRSFDPRRPGERFGMVRHMADYDADFAAAWQVIREEHPDLPRIFLAHSTGGLVASMWVYRHPGQVDALILNDPWLGNAPADLPLGRWTPAVVSVLGLLAPLATQPTSPSNKYAHALSGWHEPLDGPLPQRLRPFSDDPAVRGWFMPKGWKHTPSAPATMAWARTIFAHQRLIEKHRINICCPILALVGKRSLNPGYAAEVQASDEFLHQRWTKCRPDDRTRTWSEGWTAAHRHTDSVLNADIVAQLATTLGPQVTLKRLDGIHDLYLSQPVERALTTAALSQWLGQLWECLG